MGKLRYYQEQTTATNLVLSWQLGYVLVDRTPPHITGLKAQQKGLALLV